MWNFCYYDFYFKWILSIFFQIQLTNFWTFFSQLSQSALNRLSKNVDQKENDFEVIWVQRPFEIFKWYSTDTLSVVSI